MKRRIILFILVLSFVFSTTTFAQEGKTYEVDSYFLVTCPADWIKRTDYIPHSPEIALTSPNKSQIYIYAAPLDGRSIDDVITEMQKSMTTNKPDSSRLEECDSRSVDNLDGKYLIYSITEKKQEKYIFVLFVLSKQAGYYITANGNYDNLEPDRKIIDDVISSMKILK